MRREGLGIVAVRGEGRMAAICRVFLPDPIARKVDKVPILRSGCAVSDFAGCLVSKRSEQLWKANPVAGQDPAASDSQQTVEKV